MKNTSRKFNYLISWASITNYFINFTGILFGLKLASTRVYTVTAAQGLYEGNMLHMGAKAQKKIKYYYHTYHNETRIYMTAKQNYMYQASQNTSNTTFQRNIFNKL